MNKYTTNPPASTTACPTDSDPATPDDAKSERPKKGIRFGCMPESIASDSRLKFTHWRVLHQIYLCFDPRKPDVGCWPSQETIAVNLGIKRQNVTGAISDLKRWEYLLVKKVGRNNYYYPSLRIERDNRNAHAFISENRNAPAFMSEDNRNAPAFMSEENRNAPAFLEHTTEVEHTTDTENTNPRAQARVCARAGEGEGEGAGREVDEARQVPAAPDHDHTPDPPDPDPPRLPAEPTSTREPRPRPDEPDLLGDVPDPPRASAHTAGSRKKKNLRPAFELPDWIPAEAWRAFEEMRVKIRKPMTDYARNLIVKKLTRLSDRHGDDRVSLLEQSIENGWQSVFPLRSEEKTGGNGNGSHRETNAEHYNREMAEAFDVVRAEIGLGPKTGTGNVVEGRFTREG